MPCALDITEIPINHLASFTSYFGLGSAIPERVWHREPPVPHMRGAVYPSPKEMYMKNRLTRSAYLLALLAAFVVASGAGHKFGS
jgi:hypothetical protein